MIFIVELWWLGNPLIVLPLFEALSSVYASILPPYVEFLMVCTGPKLAGFDKVRYEPI